MIGPNRVITREARERYFEKSHLEAWGGAPLRREPFRLKVREPSGKLA
jgi:hypothetical protein